jgi:alanine-glyoxylate transaminase / serine-glyoxylate transaminase / serine-pyruvate transaminase
MSATPAADLPASHLSAHPVPEPLAMSERLLCGPGPANVPPSVVEAMSQPLVGHLDPDLHAILDEITAMLGAVWGRRDGGASIALSSTGTAGMEAGIVNLVAPGATVVVGTAGFFGDRIVQIARRGGARVVEVRAEPGAAIGIERFEEALGRCPDARLVAVVHAETSTGALQPLEELAELLRDRDTLLMADCVTSLGGIELDVDALGIDYAYSCTQKCLGAPPGMSPVTVSESALDRLRTAAHPVSFLLDLPLLLDYWVGRPARYHHTVPSLSIYALHEALRLVLDEGLEERWARHADAGAHLRAGLAQRGLELLADPEVQLPQLTAVCVPDGVDGKAVQGRLLREHAIEVGGGLGPGTPPIWRIGLMGHNATRATADRVLAAFDDVLASERSARDAVAAPP